MVTIKFNRPINSEELKELNVLVENQETTDKYTDTQLHINGDYAVIDVEIDDYGDITLL